MLCRPSRERRRERAGIKKEHRRLVKIAEKQALTRVVRDGSGSSGEIIIKKNNPVLLVLFLMWTAAGRSPAGRENPAAGLSINC